MLDEWGMRIHKSLYRFIGPCKSVSNLNPESLHVWKMNLWKVVWNLNPRNMKNFEPGILSNLKFESRILPFWHLNLEAAVCLKFESRIPGHSLTGFYLWGFMYKYPPPFSSNKSWLQILKMKCFPLDGIVHIFSVVLLPTILEVNLVSEKLSKVNVVRVKFKDGRSR